MRSSIVLLALLLFAPFAQGQVSPLVFNSVPSWSNNTRFGVQPLLPQVKHPSLTLNGFDCTANGCGKGLGLIQTMKILLIMTRVT